VTRFLGIAIFIVVAAGMVIHAGVDLPWFLNWIGQLPGDMLVKKGKLTIFVPVSSSLLISAVLSFVLSIFSSERK
jgi:hypothetical protein